MAGRPNDSPVIAASEIAQYAYCPLSWYLKRCGSQPSSPGLAAGIEKHNRAGMAIYRIQSKEMRAKLLRHLGFISFFGAALAIAGWLL